MAGSESNDFKDAAIIVVTVILFYLFFVVPKRTLEEDIQEEVTPLQSSIPSRRVLVRTPPGSSVLVR